LLKWRHIFLLAPLRRSYAEAGQVVADVRVRRSFSGGARKPTHCLQKNSRQEATTNGRPALPVRRFALAGWPARQARPLPKKNAIPKTSFQTMSGSYTKTTINQFVKFS